MASASWLSKWRVLISWRWWIIVFIWPALFCIADGAHFVWPVLSLNRHRRYHFYDFFLWKVLPSRRHLCQFSLHTPWQPECLTTPPAQHRHSASAFCCHQFVKLRTWFVLSGTIFVCRMPGHLSHSRGPAQPQVPNDLFVSVGIYQLKRYFCVEKIYELITTLLQRLCGVCVFVLILSWEPVEWKKSRFGKKW